jgi:hypothetical protein
MANLEILKELRLRILFLLDMTSSHWIIEFQRFCKPYFKPLNMVALRLRSEGN